MKYRPEIDGLRAVAVVPVILFHAGFELFSGGFVGVDVFFVISGYLITTILIKDIENNRFSIVNFYERRARRILPALFFVMLACIPFAWMWMFPGQMKDFSQSLVAVSLFASNILFWIESGYFDAAAEEKPLLHTWSLAVEEQYYVVFPIFLFLAWRFGKNKVFWMIVVLSAISLALSEWGWRNKPTANFYLAPTRTWELFAGSIAAFIVQKRGVQSNNTLSMLGLAAIVFAIFAYDETTPFPSLYALVPVLGVVLLVLFAGSQTLPAKLLSTKVFVGIGLISYSAYLWHQPLFAFARLRIIEGPTVYLMGFLSCASIVLAIASWRYVEKPFRNKNTVCRKSILLFSASGLTLFIGLGVYCISYYKEINAGAMHPFHSLRAIQLGGYNADNGSLWTESWAILRGISEEKSYAVVNNAYDRTLWFKKDSNDSARVLLVGNSHSKDLFNTLFQTEGVGEDFQLARFGVQLKEMGPKHEFWNSPNYEYATHVMFVTRFTEKDVEMLDYVIKRGQEEGKRISIVSRIFEFPGEASGYSLIDQVVYSNRGKKVKEIADLVNLQYYQYFFSAVSNHSFSINKRLLILSETFDVPFLNRMGYICNDAMRVCFAVQQDLTKNFYDYGHHTLKGAAYFSNSEILRAWFYRFIEKQVTVGMPVTRHPPCRSQRALLTHWAPPSGVWRQIDEADMDAGL